MVEKEEKEKNMENLEKTCDNCQFYNKSFEEYPCYCCTDYRYWISLSPESSKPKEQLEKENRPCNAMTFEHAIEAMKQDEKVARSGRMQSDNTISAIVTNTFKAHSFINKKDIRILKRIIQRIMKKSETVDKTCDNCAFCNVAFYEPPCSLCCKPDNKWTPASFTEIKDERTCDNCKFSEKRPFGFPCANCEYFNNWTPMYSEESKEENKTVEELEEICVDNHYQKRDKMEIRITNHGFLEFWRGNKWKEQDCPLTGDNGCGDWCPMFREPEVCDDIIVRLQLCQVTLVAEPDNFEDLR